MEGKRGGATPYIEAVTRFIFVEDAPQQADVIFVPGCSEPRHTLRAAELYHAGYAPYVLPSGRFTKVVGHFAGVKDPWQATYTGDYETEWEFLRDVLMRAGVPEAAILREDQATYTWENAQLSRDVLACMGITPCRAILCCKPFHARRALMYYQAAMPQTEFLVCPGEYAGCSRTDWFLTREGRDTVLGEVYRCGAQVGEVLEGAMRRDGIIP
ncbi:MAG: YdcF family protein [Clostridia bacterium]|nr:YdcF family protein [Clostridia bacterium]